MKLYGKAEETAARLVSLFETGSLPAALAPVMVTTPDGVPSGRWSWSNRLLAALAGHPDARGFRQWQEVGRNVKKGEKAFCILAPLFAKMKDAETGEEKPRPYGFKGVPVFGYSQTEGEPIAEYSANDRLLESLPLVTVAQAWGINVTTADLTGRGSLGYYSAGASAIVLGDHNAQTWAHELMHAADDRAGNLKRKDKDDKARAEVVAELGAATLLTMLGHPQADTGGAWAYISHWCKQTGKPPIGECIACINRICAAIRLILDTAETQNSIAA